MGTEEIISIFSFLSTTINRTNVSTLSSMRRSSSLNACARSPAVSFLESGLTVKTKVKPDSRKDTKSLPVYINLVKYVQTLKWKREVYGSHQQQTKAQTLCPGRS